MSSIIKIITIITCITFIGTLPPAEESHIIFPKPLRINEINWFEISYSQHINFPSPEFQIIAQKFPDIRFHVNAENSSFSQDAENNRTTVFGYFFLPNVIPIGKVSVKTAVHENPATADLHPEIVFRTPLFIKGWPLLSHSAETGMKTVTAESFPLSETGFLNPQKQAFLFFSVVLAPNVDQSAKYKMRVFVKEFLLDEVDITRAARRYAYCLPQKLIGKIDWLIIRFETYSPSGKLSKKTKVVKFEYIRLVPCTATPTWAYRLMQKESKIPPLLRCIQQINR